MQTKVALTNPSANIEFKRLDYRQFCGLQFVLCNSQGKPILRCQIESLGFLIGLLQSWEPKLTPQDLAQLFGIKPTDVIAGKVIPNPKFTGVYEEFGEPDWTWERWFIPETPKERT